MDGNEMRTMGEAARMTEHLADLVGTIILQLMRKQDYVEERGVKALLSHVRQGKGVRTLAVPERGEEDFCKLLKEARIPYVEISHRDPVTREKTLFFVYRDSDERQMGDVWNRFTFVFDHSCREMDPESFARMMEGKTFGKASGLSGVEVFAFREAAKDSDIRFCVTSDGDEYDQYAVVADDKEALSDVLADASYYLSGERGHRYFDDLESYGSAQTIFEYQTRPKPDTVKYVVDVKNPRNFISIESQCMTTHSIGTREEKKPDGSVMKVLYDARHATYPGRDMDQLKLMALKMGKPVVLSQEEFLLVKGLTDTREAVLADDFVEQYDQLVGKGKKMLSSIFRRPEWKPFFQREDLDGFSGLPMDVVTAIRKENITDLYCNGADIAFPKEARYRVNMVLADTLFHGMGAAEYEEAMAQYYNVTENEAVDFMLTIEPMEMAALHEKIRLPWELMNDTQKEAMERFEKIDLTEETMGRREEKRIREQVADRRIAQEMER